jgi:hypothetical protein
MRIRILLLIKVMQIPVTDTPLLHFSAPQLLNSESDADPDPAFDSDPDPASKNYKDPEAAFENTNLSNIIGQSSEDSRLY